MCLSGRSGGGGGNAVGSGLDRLFGRRLQSTSYTHGIFFVFSENATLCHC